MMKKLLLLGIAAVALTASVPAQAALNMSGQTGLMNIPTADVAAPMTLQVAADYIAAEEIFVPMRIGFGVIDGLEIGANYNFIDTNDDPMSWGVNAKYRLPLVLAEGLGIAVGGGYSSLDSDAFADAVSTIGVYGVASYNALVGDFTIQPSVGMSFERVDFGDNDDNGIRFFGGVLAWVMPNLGVGVEFVSTNEDLDGNDADADVWFGARYIPIENLTVQAGMINNSNVGDQDVSDFVFHVGGQYAFSFGM